MDQLIAQLKRHEGFKAHAYRCSAGLLTPARQDVIINMSYNLGLPNK